MRTGFRSRRAALVGAIALAATPVLALPASASNDIDGGLWYYTATGMDEVHQRTTGEGVHIALINGLINPDVPDLQGTGLVVREPSYCAAEDGGPALQAASTVPGAQHATGIASVLLGNGTGLGGQPGVRGIAPGATVTAYAVNGPEEGSCRTIEDATISRGDAFRDAVADGADIVVVPGTISMSTADYVAALRAGVIVVGAGGNDGLTVSGWPAALNGAVATGTVGPGAVLDPGSVTGEHLGVVAPGADIRTIDPTFSTYGISTGSSNSSAYTAGALALLWSEYPDATANQILQALVRTTDGTEHEPSWDEDYGFGSVHVRALVDADPTSYPDENPFVSDGSDEVPTADELGSGTPVPADSPTSGAPDAGATEPDDSAAADPSEDGEGAPVTIIAIAAALAVAAIIVTAVVLTRRRRVPTRTDDLQHGGHHG